MYYNTVLGKQAITHINQDGFRMNLIYRDPYYSGMLAQNATLAVKFAQAQALTQDTAIRNLLSTKSTTVIGGFSMAEYSRTAKGSFTSSGNAQINLPFQPDVCNYGTIHLMNACNMVFHMLIGM